MSTLDRDPVKELFDRERDQIVSHHGNDLHWQSIVHRARAQRRSRFLGYAAGMTAAGLILFGVTYGAFLHNGTTLLPATSSSKSATTPNTPIRPCSAGALSLGYGPRVSAATGEQGDFYVLINHGAVPCTLNGYPDVALDDANGKPLPFHYVHGHGQYVTSKPPSTVALAPRASASILVAKYRCDVGEDRAAVTIRLTLPAPQHFVLTARASSDGAGVSKMSYCLGGPTDPGQTVEVSPIEPTQRPLSN